MQILVNKKDPNEFGFKISDEELAQIPEKLGELNFVGKNFWRQIQQAFMKEREYWEKDPRVNWIFEMDFSD